MEINYKQEVLKIYPEAKCRIAPDPFDIYIITNDADKTELGSGYDSEAAWYVAYQKLPKKDEQQPVTYTEEDMIAAWQQGYSNGLLYDMSDELVGEKPDFNTWLTDYKQSKSK